MLSSCHSNGFSDIYKGDSGGGGEKVCRMDIRHVAFCNHPGGTGTDTPADKRGWLAWESIGGKHLVSGYGYASHSAHVVEEEHFDQHGNPYTIPVLENSPGMEAWMNEDGQNGTPHIEFSDTGRPGWKNSYVSQLVGHPDDEDGDPLPGIENLEWTRQWDDSDPNNPHWVYLHPNAVYCFYPLCDRLMFAQNLYWVEVDGKRAVYPDKATIKWFSPRIRSNFAHATNVRPYRAPLVSVRNWAPEMPPFASLEYGDWRFNPKINVSNWNPSYNVNKQGTSGRDDPDFGPDEGAVAKQQSMAYLDYVIRYRLTQGESIRGNCPLDFDPKMSGFGYDPTDLIMLYGVRTERREISEGNWRTYITDPIYWDDSNKSGGLDAKPGFRWGIPMGNLLSATRTDVDGAEGTDVYGGKNSGVPPMFRTDSYDILAEIPEGTAFDLRAYCIRYNWKAWYLMEDPRHPGQYIKAEDEHGEKLDKTYGYFNTRCFLSVRQVVPSVPRSKIVNPFP